MINKKNIVISISVAAVITILLTVMFSVKVYADKVQKNIADKVLRLHIVAESNSYENQKIKLEIRDEIINLLKEDMKNVKTKEESIEIIEKRYDDIIKTAKNVLAERKMDKNVSVDISKTMFPSRNYGNIRLPAGTYDSINIKIGKAEGRNWWCIMYPSFCFDENGLINYSANNLKNILTESEYNVINNDGKLNIRFAVVDFVKSIENKF